MLNIFDDLSSRLNTGPRTGALGSYFIQAKSGSKYEMIHQKKMDESSFNLKEESINKTIQESNQAYFGRFRDIASHECEVKQSFHKDLVFCCQNCSELL